jgi:hypothetical protein
VGRKKFSRSDEVFLNKTIGAVERVERKLRSLEGPTNQVEGGRQVKGQMQLSYEGCHFALINSQEA